MVINISNRGGKDGIRKLLLTCKASYMLTTDIHTEIQFTSDKIAKKQNSLNHLAYLFVCSGIFSTIFSVISSKTHHVFGIVASYITSNPFITSLKTVWTRVNLIFLSPATLWFSLGRHWSGSKLLWFRAGRHWSSPERVWFRAGRLWFSSGRVWFRAGRHWFSPERVWFRVGRHWFTARLKPYKASNKLFRCKFLLLNPLFLNNSYSNLSLIF